VLSMRTIKALVAKLSPEECWRHADLGKGGNPSCTKQELKKDYFKKLGQEKGRELGACAHINC